MRELLGCLRGISPLGEIPAGAINETEGRPSLPSVTRAIQIETTGGELESSLPASHKVLVPAVADELTYSNHVEQMIK